jgi:hypothetical protein
VNRRIRLSRFHHVFQIDCSVPGTGSAATYRSFLRSAQKNLAVVVGPEGVTTRVLKRPCSQGPRHSESDDSSAQIWPLWYAQGASMTVAQLGVPIRYNR